MSQADPALPASPASATAPADQAADRRFYVFTAIVTVAALGLLTWLLVVRKADPSAGIDLRFMPEYAIQTAVDYGMQNLKALSKAGYALDSLDDGDKAKIVYLCHHLGIRDAKRFIDNTITEDRAKKLLITQIGSQRAKKYADNASGSYVKGHRSWLGDFIDSHVMLIRFECTKSGTDTQRKLIDITTNLSD